jgi:hypothetical protein
MTDTEQTTKSTVGTHETGAVEHERVAQPEINLGREREYETGKDESWFANIKRTYDEFQHESLDSIRKNSAYIQRILSTSAEYDGARQNIANQALQNAVETSNMVSKQTIRHSENGIETANMTGKQANRHADVAIDRQWNVDEQGYTVADILRDSTFKDAIAAAVAVAVNQVNQANVGK